MKSSLVVRSIVLMAAVALPLAASAGHPGPYVGLFGGINFVQDQNVGQNGVTQNRFGLDNGPMFGMTYGWAFASGFRPELELGYRHNNYDAVTGAINSEDVTGNEDAWTPMVNLWFDMRQPTGFFSVVHPYIGGGIGAIFIEMHNPNINGVESRSGNATGFAYQGGAGVGIDVLPRLTLTMDYRHLEGDERTYGSSAGPVEARYRADSAMLGMRFAFGGAPAPAQVRVVQAPRVAPAPRAAVPPPAVIDGDSDGDGVRDSRDQCPGTPRGFAVNADGCIEEAQTVILRGINFTFNSDELTAPAQETLNEVAAALVAQPSLNIRIVGHTDSVGSGPLNQRLSQRRAESVRSYLITQGVEADNLQARGDGESNPVSSNNTESGRAENRRVEFVVINKPADVEVKPAEPTRASKSAAKAGEPPNLQAPK